MFIYMTNPTVSITLISLHHVVLLCYTATKLQDHFGSSFHCRRTERGYVLTEESQYQFCRRDPHAGASGCVEETI